MASVQVQNLANTPDTTPLVNKDTGRITFNWNQWLTNVQIKINTINGVLVEIAGAGTVSGTFNLLSPLTTNGDILTYNASNNIRLGIGTAGQVLTVVSGLPAWATPAASSPLTTKGDLYTFSTVGARLPVGADTYVLTASSGTATGLAWAPAGTPTLPLTTKGDILGFSTVAARVPVGTDGEVLTADSTQALGVKWSTASGGSNISIVTVTGTSTTTSTTILYSSAIPTSTQGDSLTSFDITITPTSSSSNLLYTISIPMVYNGGSAGMRFAVFRDSGTSAIFARYTQLSGNYGTCNFQFVVASGSTAATTFHLRWGVSGGTGYLGKDSSVTPFGGTMVSTVSVQEFL